MDRIRSRTNTSAMYRDIFWPSEGVEFPDGCFIGENRERYSRAPQIIMEHSEDGKDWTLVYDAEDGGAGASPTGAPAPASVAPDYAGAKKRGIDVPVPQGQPPPEPKPTVLPSDGAQPDPVEETDPIEEPEEPVVEPEAPEEPERTLPPGTETTAKKAREDKEDKKGWR